MRIRLSPSYRLSSGHAKCCVECGVAGAGLITVDGQLICPDCQPRLVNKLREGIVPGPTGGMAGPWQEGDLMVVSKEGTLPAECIKCGESATTHLRREFTWHHAALYILAILSLPIYFIVAFLVCKKATYHIPVCGGCNARRVRNLVIGYLAFFLGLGLVGAAFWLVESREDLTDGLCITGLVLMLLSLLWAVMVQFLEVPRMTEQFVWIKRVSRKTLDTLPPWPGV